MNDYLVTYDGGQDVWADDLSFMQNSLKSMIDTAVRTYGDNCILWGCLDSGKENVVEGGVVISGKLYHVPALGAIGSNKLCFREVLSDERTFENKQVHKVKKQYEAYLSDDTGGAVVWIDLITAKRIYDSAGTLVDYNKSSKGDVESGDTVEQAFSKVENKIDALFGENLYTELSYNSVSDATTLMESLQRYRSVKINIGSSATDIKAFYSVFSPASSPISASISQNVGGFSFLLSLHFVGKEEEDTYMYGLCISCYRTAHGGLGYFKLSKSGLYLTSMNQFYIKV